MEEYKGKKYYNWYEVVIHQQALINELVEACKASKEWVARSEGWEVLKRLERLIVKAGKGE